MTPNKKGGASPRFAAGPQRVISPRLTGSGEILILCRDPLGVCHPLMLSLLCCRGGSCCRSEGSQQGRREHEREHLCDLEERLPDGELALGALPFPALGWVQCLGWVVLSMGGIHPVQIPSCPNSITSNISSVRPAESGERA